MQSISVGQSSDGHNGEDVRRRLQLGGSAGTSAVVERTAARRDPGRILLLDWVVYSAGHPGWFQPDGLHLTLPGAAAFTDLLARALPYAYVLDCARRAIPVSRSAERS